MKRFALKLTKGNDYRIIETFDTKEAAMVAGAEYRKQISRDNGLLSCIEADFDTDGNMSGTSYKLYESFL